VTPKTAVKAVVTLVCGVVAVTAFLSPLLSARWDEPLFSAAAYRSSAAEHAAAAAEKGEMMARRIIEDECAAYILDKGAALGIADMTASVTARWGEDGRWYPYSARVAAAADAPQLERLSQSIEAELGIPASMQELYTESEDKGDA